MKKTIKVFVAMMCMMVIAGLAMATPPCNSTLELEAFADASAYDISYDGLNNGFAGGISGGYAEAGSELYACVYNGQANGNVGATAGILVNTDSYAFHTPTGAVVGSMSDTTLILQSGLFCESYDGYAYGSMYGHGAVGSLDISYIGNQLGSTGGGAYQGTMVSFHDADFTVFGVIGCNASVISDGYTFSESVRYTTYESGSVTLGVENISVASTRLQSFGHIDSNRPVWGVAGGSLSDSYQDAGNGSAESSATAEYQGAGRLGTNYEGSAVSITGASITHVYGMQGQVSSSYGIGQVQSSYSYGN